MPASKPERPAATSRMLSQQLIDDPQKAHQVVTAAVAALETKVGQVQKLMTEPVVVTGSTGGNAALESLIAALVELGLVKDETT